MEGNGELLLFFFDILTASDLVALVLAVHLAVALERPKLFKKNWEMIFLNIFYNLLWNALVARLALPLVVAALGPGRVGGAEPGGYTKGRIKKRNSFPNFGRCIV